MPATHLRTSIRIVLVLALAALLAACAAEPGESPADETVTEPEPEEPDDPGDGAEPDDGEALAQEDPPALDEVAVTLTHVADADQPTAGAVAPDGTLYIAERAGPVRPLTGDGLGEPALDLTGETTTDSERGLLGIAFDDERLYVSFTDASDGNSRVDAFDWDGATADPDTRETLLDLEQPYGNHNGGDLTIGPDGMLWLGLGDGGGGGDPLDAGQDPSTPLGALLRFDPATGEAADDNPLGDPRVWAYGLRNPWRFSFDAESGDLWIADVGEGDREEVNWVPAGEGAGANFGWNLMEGTMEFAGSEPDDHWPPIYEYETNVDGCAITGGYVYRGSAIDGLQGAYLFADYCDGGVRALVHEDGDVTDSGELDVEGANSVVSFAQDADNEIYVLTFGDGILRLDPS